MAGDKKSHDGK